MIGLSVAVVLALVLQPSGASLGPSAEPNRDDSASKDAADEAAAYHESGERYLYLSYAEIVMRLQQLQASYPDLAEVFTTQDRFGLASAGQCDINGHQEPCKVYVIRLGNRHKQSEHTPEVFLSGELHGNERIGPTATVEFATLLLDLYRTNTWARRLLDTRSITIVPTANAIGYFSNTREELGVDPNRDFAWDQKPGQCMQTIAAQSINELWRAHVFQLSITFHGGDHMISYPWGDNIHCCSASKYTTADDSGMAALTGVLRDFVGQFDVDGKYKIGPLNKIIYPVAGGMEDWAYGASWAPNGRGNVACQGRFGYPNGRTAYNDATHRAINLLVETAFSKTPRSSTLGKRQQILHGGGGHDGDGHVPRNVRLCWLLTDLVQPWVRIANLDAIPTHVTAGAEFDVAWEAGGAVTVSECHVECHVHGARRAEAQVCTAAPTYNHRLWEQGARAPPVTTKVTVSDSVAAGSVVVVRVRVRVDEGFGSSTRPEASHGDPQSHFVRARTDPSFSVENPGSPGQAVQGQLWWESEEASLTVAGSRRAAPAPSESANRFGGGRS